MYITYNIVFPKKVTYTFGHLYNIKYVLFDSLQTSTKHNIIIKSPENTHISITFTHFSFNTTIEDMYCNYGGVAMFDFSDKEIEETAICYTELNDQANIQPFYSISNKTVVVLYSYDNYSNLSVSLKVSFTKCKVTKVNFCAEIMICRYKTALCSRFRKDNVIEIVPSLTRFNGTNVMANINIKDDKMLRY